MNKEHPGRKNEYLGRKKELETIRTALTSYRESSNFNVVGNHGSGRSELLRVIEDNITNGEWEFPHQNKPIVMILQGINFVQGINFIEFLSNQVSDRIQQAVGIKVEAGGDFPLLLSKAAAQDYPIVIMIDNFTRIMERLEPGEAQGLNRLRPAGVHYILVTDYRPLEAISPQVYEASDFFKYTRPVYLKPLNREDSVKMVEQEISAYPEAGRQPADARLLETIADIAGGMPGLLANVASYFCFQISEGHFDGVMRSGDDKRTTRFLRYLPVESAIRFSLNLLLDTIVHDLSLLEKHTLVDIALEGKGVDLSELDVDLENKFRIMGFLSAEAIRISGKLMQYTILNNVVPINFSGTEIKVFEKFYRSRPGLTSFDELTQLLKEEAPDPDNSLAFRQYIDSTVARIRKKIKEMPNRAAFTIMNERGLGFFSKSEVSFDEFYFDRPSIFSRSK